MSHQSKLDQYKDLHEKLAAISKQLDEARLARKNFSLSVTAKLEDKLAPHRKAYNDALDNIQTEYDNGIKSLKKLYELSRKAEKQKFEDAVKDIKPIMEDSSHLNLLDDNVQQLEIEYSFVKDAIKHFNCGSTK